MLLAVEGGGFFSSSASRYCKGFDLLLLGQKNEEKPVKVTPWNHYRLVDQESDPVSDLLQLASSKNRLPGRCTSFVCFSRPASGLESPSPLKVSQLPEVLPSCPAADKGKDQTHSDNIVEDSGAASKAVLKSSLKNPGNSISISGGNGNEHDEIFAKADDVPSHTEKRTVQWTDTSGGELFEIREFELGDDDDESDGEFESGSKRTCSCKIM